LEKIDTIVLSLKKNHVILV